jgi:DNA-binding phage protein
MTIEVAPYDTAEHLRTKQEIAYYIEAVIEDDPSSLRIALDDVARTTVAKEAGLPPLPDDVTSALGIVIKTLGIRLSVPQAAE